MRYDCGDSITLITVWFSLVCISNLQSCINVGKMQLGTLCFSVLQVFPLSEAADAHRQVETGHTRGKVVLSVP